MTRLRATLAGWLVTRRLGLHLALLSVALTLPALWVGWQLDDHFQRLFVLGVPTGEPGPTGIFRAIAGDSERIREAIERGFLPWWAAEDLRVAFFRPLSVSLTHLDYALWPGSARLMHAHSLLWLAALVAVATAAYRRLLGATSLAGFAALLYAIDEIHAIPAAWLANRNAMVAACFGLLCLTAHDRWRRDGDSRAGWLAPLWLALALSAGEMGLSTCGYLVAHAVFLEAGSWRRRLLALIPAGGVVSCWALVYRWAEYGTRGSAMYVDPMSDVAGFLRAVGERAPFLMMGQWWPPDSVLGMGSPPAPLWWVAFGLTVMVVLALGPLVRRDAHARFWSLGMLLALLPVCSGPPGDRLLLFVGFGAMGLLAQFLVSLRDVGVSLPGPRIWRRVLRALGVAWLVTHLLLAPVQRVVLSYSLKFLGDRLTSRCRVLIEDPTLDGQDLVVINTPDPTFLVTDPLIQRQLAGRSLPRSVRVLTAGRGEVVVTRVDELTLRLRVPEGLFSGVMGRLFRDPRWNPAVGQRFELSDVVLEIEELNRDGEPLTILARFVEPLDRASRRWICWVDDGYRPCAPPAATQTMTLPALPSLLDLERYLSSDDADRLSTR